MKSNSARNKTKSSKTKRTRKRSFFFRDRKGGEGENFFSAQKNSQKTVPAIQTDLPYVRLPRSSSIPNLGGLSAAQRQPLLAAMGQYTQGEDRASGQNLVNLVTSLLSSSGTVNFLQDHVQEGSPRFLTRPSISAMNAGVGSSAAGFTFGVNGKNRVEIYPAALIGRNPMERIAYLAGIITHEYIHVLQNRVRNPEGFTEAQREFQAWLWQARNMDRLGIRPQTQASTEIRRNLQTFFGQLDREDQRNNQTRFESALAQLNRPRETQTPTAGQ